MFFMRISLKIQDWRDNIHYSSKTLFFEFLELNISL